MKIIFLLLSIFSFNVKAEVDDQNIKKTITDNSEKLNSFARTLDVESITKVYAPNAVTIVNGKIVTKEEIEKIWLGFKEKINLGSPIRISYSVAGINVRPIGCGFVLADYDYSYKSGESGVVITEENGKCSDLMKEVDDRWFIVHSHCSTARQESPVSEDKQKL